jgi:hypothetical protein
LRNRGKRLQKCARLRTNFVQQWHPSPGGRTSSTGVARSAATARCSRLAVNSCVRPAIPCLISSKMGILPTLDRLIGLDGHWRRNAAPRSHSSRSLPEGI